MTTPIERAVSEMTRLNICLPPRDRKHAALASFDSIDTEELARVLYAWDVEGGPFEGSPFDDLAASKKAVWNSAAHTVKEFLTGKGLSTSTLATRAVMKALHCDIGHYDDHRGGGVGCYEHEMDVNDLGECVYAEHIATELANAGLLTLPGKELQ